jgi:hypothetical protein
MSALPSTSDLRRRTLKVRFVPAGPNADINCRDCLVRSLAGPEPDRQVFAKFKHLSRKAAARASKTIYVAIGEILKHYAHRMRHWLFPILKSIML